ncbi:MAG: hypothetical protein Q4G40_10625, partial [Brachybacterium sp.]|nr:hypothetical protein [Brachybacterium sp.]
MDRSEDATERPYEQLASLIAAAQTEDPFGRCTILIPHRAVAYDVLRTLTAASRAGTVNVRAITLLDLAREIVDESGDLSGREALTPTALRRALATELAIDPLRFAEVAEQPATLDALVDASQRLLRRGADPAALPPVTADVLTLHRRALTYLEGTITAQDVLASATRTLHRDSGVRERLGSVVAFQLPEQHDPASRAFAAAVTAGATVLAPPTLTDREIRTSIGRLLSVTDPVEEARAAVETAATALADGSAAAGHRIGIFFPTADPYQELVTSQLSRAGITYTARSGTPLIAQPVPRSLLRLLELDADAPDVRTVLDARWEGALQTEGVPSSRRCELAYVHGMDPASRARAATDPDGPLAGREADLAALTAVVERLGAYLHAIDAAPTWAGAVAALTDLVAGMLRPRSSTPGDRAAGRALDSALQVLARQEPEAKNPGRHVLTR